MTLISFTTTAEKKLGRKQQESEHGSQSEILKYFNNKVIFHHLLLWDVIFLLSLATRFALAGTTKVVNDAFQRTFFLQHMRRVCFLFSFGPRTVLFT